MKTNQPNRSKLQIIIFSTLLVLVLIITIASIILAASNRKKVPAENIFISNLTDSGTTITWTTSEKTDVRVYVKEKGKGNWSSLPIISILGKKANHDDRDIDQNSNGDWEVKSAGTKQRLTHSVSLRGLKPNTEYEFRIGAGLSTFDKDKNGNIFPTFKTLEINKNLGTPDPVYSKVLNLDVSKENPVDGIVYYQLVNPGKLQVKSLLYSTTLNEGSAWSGDIAGAMNASGEKFVRGDNTIISISVISEIGEKNITYALKDYKPLPNLFIDTTKVTSNIKLDKTYTSSALPLIQSVKADGKCLTDGCEAGGACMPNGSVGEKTSAGTAEEPIGTYKCIAGNWVFADSVITPDAPVTVDSDSRVCTETVPRACTDTYIESCIVGDKLGTRQCVKRGGKSLCGVSGKSCPWGEGSECFDCSIDESRTVDPKLIEAEQEAGITNPNGTGTTGNGLIPGTTISDGGGNGPVGTGIEINAGPAAEGATGDVLVAPATQDAFNGSPLGCNIMVNRLNQDECWVNLGNMKRVLSVNADSYLCGDGHNSEGKTVKKVYLIKIKANQECDLFSYSDEQPPQDIINDCSNYSYQTYGTNKCYTETSSKLLLNSKIFAASTDKPVVTESGNYSVVYKSNPDEQIGEFAVNLAGQSKLTIKLYVDANKNGVKDTDEKEISDYSQINLKKNKDVAVYNLNVGWNLVSIPIASDQNVDTASKLLEIFNKQGANVKHIAKYTGTGFQIYTKREDGQSYSNDFNLIPGEGYFILNYTAKAVKLTGNKFDESVPFHVQNGWNLVGVYTNEKTYTAEQLLKDMKAADITADTLSRYDSGMYTSVVYDVNVLYGNNFNLIERQGYFIRVEKGGGSDVTFTPKP